MSTNQKAIALLVAATCSAGIWILTSSPEPKGNDEGLAALSAQSDGGGDRTSIDRAPQAIETANRQDAQFTIPPNTYESSSDRLGPASDLAGYPPADTLRGTVPQLPTRESLPADAFAFRINLLGLEGDEYEQLVSLLDAWSEQIREQRSKVLGRELQVGKDLIAAGIDSALIGSHDEELLRSSLGPADRIQEISVGAAVSLDGKAGDYAVLLRGGQDSTLSSEDQVLLELYESALLDLDAFLVSVGARLDSSEQAGH